MIAPRPRRDPDRIRYLTSVEQLEPLSHNDKTALGRVGARFAFRATEDYLALIDWNDPRDPIRRLIIPNPKELTSWGSLDASHEAGYTVAPGVQHKYEDTVLLLCSDVCAGFCRYCFRKRLFLDGNREAGLDLSVALDYIRAHPEVTNVLLTGGDPLALPTRRLREILSALRTIPHVQIIRIGSKVPAFDPRRILNDLELHEVLRTFSEPRRRLYLMAHFDHPRELTETAVEALHLCSRLGVVAVNQCPLIRGVNDDPHVLSTLLRQLSFIGCPPYYVFQCRPTVGNAPFTVPITRGWSIFQEAVRYGSGLACRPRFVMSHGTGKLEILLVDAEYIHLRYHRARDAAKRGRLVTCYRDDSACWFDDLCEVSPHDTPEAIAHEPVPAIGVL